MTDRVAGEARAGRECNCAEWGNAYSCSVHSQADFEAAAGPVEGLEAIEAVWDWHDMDPGKLHDNLTAAGFTVVAGEARAGEPLTAIELLRYRVDKSLPIYQGDIDSALAEARREAAAPVLDVERCQCGHLNASCDLPARLAASEKAPPGGWTDPGVTTANPDGTVSWRPSEKAP